MMIENHSNEKRSKSRRLFEISLNLRFLINNLFPQRNYIVKKKKKNDSRKKEK